MSMIGSMWARMGRMGRRRRLCLVVFGNFGKRRAARLRRLLLPALVMIAVLLKGSCGGRALNHLLRG